MIARLVMRVSGDGDSFGCLVALDRGPGAEVIGWPSKKSLEASSKVTVLKPTQVGGVSILRRSGEPSLRNSANWLRNFGRRSASRSV